MKELIIIMLTMFAFSAVAEWLGIWEFVGGFLLGAATVLLFKMRQHEKQ